MGRLFIDVREPQEYATGHIEGSINLPPMAIMQGAEALKDIPKNTELVLYCLSGSRSSASMNFLKRLGYTKLVNGINKEHVSRSYSVSIVK